MLIFLIPALASARRVYEIRGRPRPGVSGLGKVFCALRRREPDPAIKITASRIAFIFRNTFATPRCAAAAEEHERSTALPSLEKFRRRSRAVVDSIARLISAPAGRPVRALAQQPCFVALRPMFLRLYLRNARCPSSRRSH